MTDTSNQTSFDDESLAVLFRRTSRLLARAYHRRDRPHHAQARVLSIVAERGSMPQRELLELLDVRSSSLSEVLAKLERSGLIKRERDPEDRRGFVVTAVTDAAPFTKGDEDADLDGADDLFACLDDLERGQLRSILRKLAAALHDDDARPGPRLGRGGRGRDGRGPGGGRGGGRGEGRKSSQGGRGMGRGGGKGRGRR